MRARAVNNRKMGSAKSAMAAAGCTRASSRARAPSRFGRLANFEGLGSAPWPRDGPGPVHERTRTCTLATFSGLYVLYVLVKQLLHSRGICRAGALSSDCGWSLFFFSSNTKLSEAPFSFRSFIITETTLPQAVGMHGNGWDWPRKDFNE